MIQKFKRPNFNITRNMKLQYIAGTAKFLRKTLEEKPDISVRELYEDLLKLLREEGYDVNSIILD